MSFDPRICAGCPIQGMHTPVPQIGPERARFLIVTDRPSATAAQQRRLLTQQQLEVFAGEMQDEGFTREDFRFTPTCHCAYDDTEHNNAAKKAILKHCRDHLLAEVEANGAEIVVPLGGDAAAQTFGRGTKISKVRGLPNVAKDFQQPVFPLLSPWLVVKYPQNGPLFRADVQSFSRFVNADYVAENAVAEGVSQGTYQIVTDLQFLIDRKAEILAFDTENTGLSWFQSGCDVRSYKPHLHKGSSVFKPRFQILTMQFATQSGEAFMLIWDHPENPIKESDKPRLRNQLRQLLCNEDTFIIGQNLKYDCLALWMTEGIRFRIGGDTLMLATLLDENSMERSLDVLTKIYVPSLSGYADEFNRDVDKSRMWEVPIDKIRVYGCGDASATLQVYQALEPQICEDERLWAHYCRVSIPGLNAFVGMESRGMFTDQNEALANFKQVMQTSVEELRVDLLGQLDQQMKREIAISYLSKPANKRKTAADALSFTRKDFLKEILFTHPRGFRLPPRVFTASTEKLKDSSLRIPSTSAKDHLPYFFEDCPFAFQLAEYVKDESLLSKSIISFEKKYIHQGKVRPTYSLHRAVTGRTSSENPNGQNFPKRGARAKAYREMFKAPEGWYVGENDLSQAELRIAACMSGDPTMIRIYQEGGDIHKATACIVLGVTMEQFERLPKAEQKDARQKAKACIAEGQMVKTRFRGEEESTPIESITQDHELWDGIEWVTHEGVESQGIRYVMLYSGFTATPDHFVYTDIGVMPFYMAYELDLKIVEAKYQNADAEFFYGILEDVDYLKGKLHESINTRSMVQKARGYGYRKLVATSRVVKDGVPVYMREDGLVFGCGLFCLQSTSNGKRKQYLARADNELHMSESSQVRGRSACFDTWRKIRCDQATLQGQRADDAAKLRSARDSESIQEQRALCSIRAKGVTARDVLGGGYRQEEQRGELRTRESSFTYSQRESSQQAHESLDGVSWREVRSYRFTRFDPEESPYIQLRNRDCDSPVTGFVRGGNSSSLVCKQSTPPNLFEAQTYDPVNAGSNHRFTLSCGATVAQCNFGFLYGMWWRKFIGYAKTQYGVDFTEREAERVRTNFFGKYTGLLSWHDRMKAFARRHKYVRSFSGRIRHLPMIDSSEEYIQQEAGRQAINSPVQEFGSSLGVMALGRMNEELDPEYIHIVGFVHDAIVYYARKEHIDWAMRTVKEYMQTNPLHEWFGLNLQVPILADVGFGEDLGNIHECEGFSLEEEFDYGSLKDKNGDLLIEVPEQVIPPNNGRLTRSPYTLPEDREDEDVRPAYVIRRRPPPVAVSLESTVKRMARSKKQMVINRRNQELTTQVHKAFRAGIIHRKRPG